MSRSHILQMKTSEYAADVVALTTLAFGAWIEAPAGVERVASKAQLHSPSMSEKLRCDSGGAAPAMATPESLR